MTTIAQMKSLLKDQLSTRSDLFMVRRDIILKPINHFIKGVCIDNSSGKIYFQPKWFIQMIFFPIDCIDLRHGNDIYAPAEDIDGWDITQSNIADVLFRVMDAEAFSPFKSLTTVDDHITYAPNPHAPWSSSYERRATRWLFAHAAAGRFDAAKLLIAMVERDISRRSVPAYYAETLILTELRPLIEAGDRAGVGAFLRRCEEYTVTALKLNRYWEPMPYPVEVGA